MPELPEVEVCRRGLRPELEGRVIEGVVCRVPKLRQEIPPVLAELLQGCRVQAVRGAGKSRLQVRRPLPIGLGEGPEQRSRSLQDERSPRSLVLPVRELAADRRWGARRGVRPAQARANGRRPVARPH